MRINEGEPRGRVKLNGERQHGIRHPRKLLLGSAVGIGLAISSVGSIHAETPMQRPPLEPTSQTNICLRNNGSRNNASGQEPSVTTTPEAQEDPSSSMDPSVISETVENTTLNQRPRRVLCIVNFFELIRNHVREYATTGSNKPIPPSPEY